MNNAKKLTVLALVLAACVVDGLVKEPTKPADSGIIKVGAKAAALALVDDVAMMECDLYGTVCRECQKQWATGKHEDGCPTGKLIATLSNGPTP